MLPQLDNLTGVKLEGDIEMQALLGEGGMGLAYSAYQHSLGREVCVKFMRSELLGQGQDWFERFKREAKAMANIDNEQVVRVYSVGLLHNTYPYMVMELAQGTPLRELISRHPPLPWKETCTIFVQICRALSVVHENGFVHRDLKPDNIFVTNLEGRSSIKLLDFGLCGLLERATALTATSDMLGSVQYMAPECFQRAQHSAAVDTYSVGCMLFEFLTGAPPFTADSPVGVAFHHTNSAIPQLKKDAVAEDAPRTMLQAVIETACAKLPQNRFTDMEECANYLQGIIDGHFFDELVPKEQKSPKSKKPLIIMAALLGAFTVLVAAALIQAKKSGISDVPGISGKSLRSSSGQKLDIDGGIETASRITDAYVKEYMENLPETCNRYKFDAYILGGVLNHNLHPIQSSIDRTKRCIALLSNKRTDSPLLVPALYIRSGQLHLLAGEPQIAATQFEIARKIMSSMLDYPELKLSTYDGLGQSAFLLHQYKQAGLWWKKCCEIPEWRYGVEPSACFLEVRSPEQSFRRRRAYLCLALANWKTGREKAASEYFDKGMDNQKLSVLRGFRSSRDPFIDKLSVHPWQVHQLTGWLHLYKGNRDQGLDCLWSAHAIAVDEGYPELSELIHKEIWSVLRPGQPVPNCDALSAPNHEAGLDSKAKQQLRAYIDKHLLHADQDPVLNPFFLAAALREVGTAKEWTPALARMQAVCAPDYLKAFCMLFEAEAAADGARWESAERKIQELSAIRKMMNPEIHSTLDYEPLQAFVLQNLGRHEEARQIARSLMRNKPKEGGPRTTYLCLYFLGTSETSSILQILRSLNTACWLGIGLARQLVERGRAGDAIQVLDEWTETEALKTEWRIEYLTVHALARVANNNPGEAQNDFRKAVGLVRQDPAHRGISQLQQVVDKLHQVDAEKSENCSKQLSDLRAFLKSTKSTDR